MMRPEGLARGCELSDDEPDADRPDVTISVCAARNHVQLTPPPPRVELHDGYRKEENELRFGRR